jgi:hypothetical protein
MNAFVHGQEIAVVKRVEVETLSRKESQAAGQRFDFVEIEREEKNPVEKPMPPRREARVHDVAFIEARFHSDAWMMFLRAMKDVGCTLVR